MKRERGKLPGDFSFARGHQNPEEKTLIDLARKGGDDLLHVINRLLNDGSKKAEDQAEMIFDRFA